MIFLPIALVVAASGPQPLPRPFGRGSAYFHPTNVAPYTFENTIVRVRFDFESGIVYGDETAIVRAKHGGLRTLPFNSLGIRYDRVTVNGKPVSYAIDQKRQLINVALGAPATAGERLVIDFKYLTQPQRGVYFVRPDEAYPGVTPEIWTQGQPIDNRRWFPTWDEPNQKTPSELIITVPRGWTAVANGYLKSHGRTAASEIWDWNAPLPKATYLIAFAAGPLSKHHTTLGQAAYGDVARYGNGDIAVDSYVQPPYADLNAGCFGRTNDMVAYFQQVIGVKYPWEKYDQTTAERFTYGGMENASATIQKALALHPAIEDVESSCDVLVSHELAQQWWGDDVTMADWSNAWIHEGFATYFHELWIEKRFGEAAFEYERYRSQQAYFKEASHYYRPVVDYVYSEPLDLFDASGHERPGEILHMLRHRFGDKRFFKALHDYLIEYQFRNVTTHQFFAAIGKSLGTDLTWFENEWFYRAAHPHYYVTQRYDSGSHTLQLDVRQENHDGKPFRAWVEIAAYAGDRKYWTRTLIERNDQTVAIAGMRSRPQMVLFDPNNNVLRELTFPKSADDLAYQVVNAAHVGDREWALTQLGGLTGADASERGVAMRAVREAALADRFYGVRADASATAAAFGDNDTVDAALHDRDKRVRIAAEQAAGGLAGASATVVSDLEAMSNDADPIAAAAALTSLGALKAPGAYDRLFAALSRSSFREQVASGAILGLAAYGDMRAFPLIQERTAYGTQDEERNAAIVGLAQLSVRAKNQALALPLLLDIVAHDPLTSSRIAATSALGVLGDARAIPVLERVELADSQLLVQIAAWNAVVAIKDAVNAG